MIPAELFDIPDDLFNDPIVNDPNPINDVLEMNVNDPIAHIPAELFDIPDDLFNDPVNDPNPINDVLEMNVHDPIAHIPADFWTMCSTTL